MADEKFDLVFRGELVPGADLAQVKNNLSRLFKMEPARIEQLFAGKAVVLKRGMDMDAAGKYRVAIKKAGARIDTMPSQVAAGVKADVNKPDERQPVEPSRPPAAASDSPVQEQGLSLVPLGGDILAPSEKSHQPDVQVNTANLSLRPASGSLLDDSEREEVPPLPLDLQELDLAPAGSDVLKPEERKPQVEADLDLRQLSMAPPGERLAAPKAAPPPAPDVSELSLTDDEA